MFSFHLLYDYSFKVAKLIYLINRVSTTLKNPSSANFYILIRHLKFFNFDHIFVISDLDNVRLKIFILIELTF